MNDFIKLIENFNLSQVLIVICAFIGLILSVENLIKWILSKFNWYHKRKSQEEDLQEVLKDYVKQNEKQNEQIEEILIKLELLTKATVENLRYSITKVCEDYLKRGRIASYELKDLEEIFKKYDSIKGNSYVHTLIYKVRKLEVINNHDE